MERDHQIRNKITHEGGYVSSEWKSFEFAETNELVSSSGYSQSLELTRAFCEEALDNFERFLLQVSHATKKGAS